MTLQLKLQDRSTEFDVEDVWSDDLLRNRDEAGRKLYTIISNVHLRFALMDRGAQERRISLRALLRIIIIVPQ